MNPLAGCHAKLRQAETHAQAFHEEIRAFRDVGALRIGHKPDPHSSDFIFFVEAPQQPPVLPWGCRIGDVLHNLRCALDHLAWQLAISGLGRQPTADEAGAVTCPIALRPGDFDSLRVLSMLDPDHVSTLRRLQPYQAGSRELAEKHPLALLKQLSNFDKHRVVHLSFVALREFPLSATASKDYEVKRITTVPLDTPLEHGQELARVEGRITGPEPEIEGAAKLRGHIALSDGSPAQHTIDELGRSVRDFIGQFEPIVQGDI